jgi:hypothetical protein
MSKKVLIKYQQSERGNNYIYLGTDHLIFDGGWVDFQFAR